MRTVVLRSQPHSHNGSFPRYPAMKDLNEPLNWVEAHLEEFRDSFLGTSMKVCLQTTDFQPRNRVGEACHG